MQLSTVILNTEKILNALKIDEPDVQKAEAFIQRNGGPDEVRQVRFALRFTVMLG